MVGVSMDRRGPVPFVQSKRLSAIWVAFSSIPVPNYAFMHKGDMVGLLGNVHEYFPVYLDVGCVRSERPHIPELNLVEDRKYLAYELLKRFRAVGIHVDEDEPLPE